MVSNGKNINDFLVLIFSFCFESLCLTLNSYIILAHSIVTTHK
jgi:hypothetical protein